MRNLRQMKIVGSSQPCDWLRTDMPNALTLHFTLHYFTLRIDFTLSMTLTRKIENSSVDLTSPRSQIKLLLCQ